MQIHTKESVHLFAADNDDDLLDWLNSLQYVAFGEHSAVDPRNLTASDDSQQIGRSSADEAGQTSGSSSANHTASEKLNKSKNSDHSPTNLTSDHESTDSRTKSDQDPVQQENQLYCSLDQPDVFRVTIAPTDAAMRCRLRALIPPIAQKTVPDLQSNALLSSISSSQSAKLGESANESEYGNVGNGNGATSNRLPACTYLLQFSAISISVCEDLRPHSQPPAVGTCLYVWPFRHIRRYGCTPEAFSLEAGRKCDSGAGMFCFHSSNAQTIFRKLASYVNALRQEEQLTNRSLPSNVRTTSNATTGNSNADHSRKQVKPLQVDGRSLSPLRTVASTQSSQNSNNCFSSSSGCSSNGSSTPSSGSASPFVPPELPSRCRPNEIANRSAGNLERQLNTSKVNARRPIDNRPQTLDNRVVINSNISISPPIPHPRVQTNRSLPPDLLNQLPTKSDLPISNTNGLSNSCANLKNGLTNKADVQSISYALRCQLNQSMPQLGNEPLYYQKHSIQIPSTHADGARSPDVDDHGLDEINNNHQTGAKTSGHNSDECMYDSVAEDPTDPIFESRQDLFGQSNHHENAYEVPESGYSELRFNSIESDSGRVQIISCNQESKQEKPVDGVDGELLSSLLSKATVDHRITEKLPAETVRNLSCVIRSVLGTSALQRIQDSEQVRSRECASVAASSNNHNHSNNPFCGPQCLAATEAKVISQNQFTAIYEPIEIAPADLTKKIEPEHYVHNECEYARVMKRNVVIEHL